MYSSATDAIEEALGHTVTPAKVHSIQGAKFTSNQGVPPEAVGFLFVCVRRVCRM